MVAMHLLVPFAAPLSDAGRAALSTLQLPRLQALLARLGEPRRDDGDEWSLSPPHERALAREAGVPGVADGLVPLAALEARRAGLASPGSPEGWAWLWPAHWRLGTEQVSLHDPAALRLDEAQSRALLEVVAPLFLSEGFELHYRLPHAWLARHDALSDLPTASVDRVIGRNVDRWLGADPRGRLLRRLQNEAQMLLHDHPLNEQRESRGELAVNSVWVGGTGCAPAGDLPASLRVDDRLRAPALAEDWEGWCRAWAALDAGPIADWTDRDAAGPDARLTLCGERSSASWSLSADASPRLARLLRGWSASARRSRAIALLETL
jgi:hypothetical protein